MPTDYKFYYDEKGILRPSEKRVKITTCTECGKYDKKAVKGLCMVHYRKQMLKKKHTRGTL